MRTSLGSIAAVLILLPSFAVASTLDDLQSQLQFLQLQIAALQTHAAGAVAAGQVLGASTACPNFTRTLSLGMSGSDVTALQDFLISQGDLAAGNNTGFYGALTEAAVQSFQRRNNIVSSGTPSTTGYGAVGPRTRDVIASVCAGSTLITSTDGAESVIPIGSICSSTGQLCSPMFTTQITTGSALKVDFPVPQTFCSSGRLHFFVDGTEKKVSAWLGWQGATGVFASLALDTGLIDLGPVSNGTHTLGVQMEGQTSGCNAGVLGRWSGNLKVTTTPVQIACTPDASSPQTQTLSCPAGQIGSISQVRISTCASGAPAPTWSTWTTTSNTCVATTLPNPTPNSAGLITTAHRYAPTMYSGWGPHLGHLLESSGRLLWFVDDTGNDVNVNPMLAYYRYQNGQWSQAATQALSGTVQQNMGSVISGDTIYSYGVDIANSRVEECSFNTTTLTHACNLLPFNTGSASNYIGATISQSGTRVVWWTNAVSAGSWNYIYNYGGGWNGPQTYTIGGYTDFSYSYGRLSNDNSHFEISGYAAKGLGGSSVGYAGLYGGTILGTPLSNWQLLEVTGGAMETWIDSADGTHVISSGQAQPQYWYKAKNGTLSSKGSIAMAGVIGARIVQTVSTVFLVLSVNDGTLKYKSLPVAQAVGPIDWNSLATKNIDVPAGLGNITVYPESPMYQATAAQTANIAINGWNQPGSVYFLSISTSGTVTPPTPTPTPTPTPPPPITNASCIFNGQTIANGSSITAYQSVSVPWGQQCISQLRACANGTLSGTYQFALCSVEPPPSVSTTNGPVTLTAQPGGVSAGGYSTLSLSTSGVTLCTIAGGIYGSGQQTQIPTWSGWTGVLSQNTTFTASCSGSGSYSTSVTVQVK